MSYESIQDVFVKFKPICAEIATEPTIDKLQELQNVLPHVPTSMLQGFQEYLLFPLSVHLKGDKIKSKEEVKRTVVDAIKDIFELTRVEKSSVLFELYRTLINQIYSPKNPSFVANIHEEYKLSIIECFTAMFKSVSWDILTEVYSRQQAPMFSQIIYVCLEIAKTEKLRKLRIAAMECILIIARVHDQSDTSDKEIQSYVADIFMLFLPRIVSTMGYVVLEDNKVGHKIIVNALRVWGRIITLLMQNYGAPDEEVDFTKLNLTSQKADDSKEQSAPWKTAAELKTFLESSQRTLEWYKKTDLQLKPRIKALAKLQSDPHPNIRSELADICIMMLENCIRTMPESIGKIVEILLVLSEDDYESIQTKSRNALNNLSKHFSAHEYTILLENLQEDFFTYISTLPTIINNCDEDKISCLNLLIGYLRLFGNQQLVNIFYSHQHLKRLIMGLIFLSRLNSHNVCILEEHTTQVLELNPQLRTPWKQFTHFHMETASAQNKIHVICSLLIFPEVFDIISDYLLEIFLNESENRKEATFLLNELASVKSDYDNIHIIKNILNIYTDPDNWNLALKVSPGSNESLLEVQNNVIQVCLLVEGVGKIATMLGEEFQQFILKCLYLVLERAGSALPLVQEAGLGAMTNISQACGYSNITELISHNTDYFSYHVIHKLRRIEENEDVLDVLAVVMKYSTIDVLPHISDIVNGVLMQSCDKYQSHNINSFLRIFLVFIKCLHNWLHIEVDKNIPETKSKDEDFKISGGINYDNNFSDDIMEGKSAEELYKEDMEQKMKEDEEPNEDIDEETYKKPEPPLYVQLTVSIMKRTLHFLPSRDKSRKLLVIEILKDGFEVIREWEDELLPLVHQTWSPLVARFKEFEEPLIINLSFQLLITLARLSKYFIRSRTTKDVLPSINIVLKKLSPNSRLKDKGSMYRYTQAYKLQLELLSNLPLLIICLEMPPGDVKSTLESVTNYLSDKQPIPLQEATVDLMNTLKKYDYVTMIQSVLETVRDKECEKNRQHIFPL